MTLFEQFYRFERRVFRFSDLSIESISQKDLKRMVLAKESFSCAFVNIYGVSVCNLFQNFLHFHQCLKLQHEDLVTTDLVGRTTRFTFQLRLPQGHEQRSRHLNERRRESQAVKAERSGESRGSRPDPAPSFGQQRGMESRVTEDSAVKGEEMEPVPPWREAASVMIVVRTSLQELVGNNLASMMHRARSSDRQPASKNHCDYRLLMVKRSGLSSFMANAYVYPGGLVEIADYSPRWYAVFEAVGVTRRSLEEFASGVEGPRPRIITESVTLQCAGVPQSQQSAEGGPLPPDVALRIAAVRETFEETGVLLMARGGPSSSPPSSWYEGVDVVSWQERIRRDPLAFADFCLEARVCPDIWSLHEWWDWLTPTSVGHRRYDTMFYVCCLEKQPDVVLDHSEVVTLKWCTPEEMLEEHSTNAVFLAPPQVYELSRLLHFSSFQALRSFAGERARKGVQRWLPVIVTCMDGAISLLPGDEMYPRKPDYLGKSPGPDYPASVDEMRKRHSGIHRIEVRGPICTARCTVSPPCGHLQPLTYRPDGPLVQSYL
ncbi:nucleoside diphosphate-linked moiety X motif 19 [Caerostris darwini]|uniref:Nucleoside diphosphate-linked moiety X motif 19 n=1 Tax=Caerostris darwini TaxID=1538125 RepID=A0AAV4RDK2_9ARAC|nr:nucleoside diphosphate-linked moiety X motif 19 [Caerostris darwini]